MSEILSEEELNELEKSFLKRDLLRAIASHRALRQERDAWRAKSWTDLVQFISDAKENLLQQYCNLQLLYGEQKHALRRLQAERDALKVELAERKDRFHALALEPRGLDPERACAKCRGFGVTMYATTATWRGGHGGQAITQDVCCHCWGSGDAQRPWKSWRSIDALKAELAEAAAIAEDIGPLVYDSLYLQVRNSQEAKEFMLRDPRFQKAARFLEKREAQP